MDLFTGTSDSTATMQNLESLDGVLADLASQATSNAADKPFGHPTASGDEALPDESDLVGSKCEVMTFYNHASSERGARWSEFRDPLAEEGRLKELGKTFAVIHRQCRIKDKGQPDLVSWVTRSIEAQSPRLRTILDAVFSEYPSWYPDESPYAVAPPFKPYVHRWHRFLDACGKRHSDNKTIDELQLLRRELEPRIEGHLSVLERVRKTGVVAFEDLWVILNPGCLVVSGLTMAANTRAYKLIRASYVPAVAREPARYEITLAYTDWNGAYSGMSTTEVKVIDYESSISVTRLPVCPIELVPHWDETEEQLLTRGRKFEALRGYHVKESHGKKYTLRTNPFTGCLEEVEKPVSVKPRCARTQPTQYPHSVC